MSGPRLVQGLWHGQEFPITEHLHQSACQRTFYLACGALDAPLIIFVHGWPELSHSWRHQLPVFAALGFRAIAPDMRGYGRSTVHGAPDDYRLEAVVADMIELLNGLGREKAIWVGHDWGSNAVWAFASHHPDRCFGVANLCVPYLPNGESAIPYVDRSTYPEDRYPVGQWDYILFYQERFAKAVADFEGNIAATIKALFRKGDPLGRGKPAFTTSIRARGGWWGGAPEAPEGPADSTVVTAQDVEIYAEGLTRNGFTGPCSWYLNFAANGDYAKASVNRGRLDMPVLFVHGAFDYTCQTLTGRLADPMRAACANLTEMVANTGHWMAQENPIAVNKALAAWISAQLPEVWYG